MTDTMKNVHGLTVVWSINLATYLRASVPRCFSLRLLKGWAVSIDTLLILHFEFFPNIEITLTLSSLYLHFIIPSKLDKYSQKLRIAIARMKLTILLSAVTLTTALPAFPFRNSATAGAGAGAGGCKAMTVVFARGTTEPGTLGTIAGPPFISALGDAVGGADKVDAQGVDYPADIPGFLAGGDADGSKLMAQMVGDALTKCPDTKVVMAGYSQGGQLVHNAAEMLTPAQSAAVSSGMSLYFVI